MKKILIASLLLGALQIKASQDEDLPIQLPDGIIIGIVSVDVEGDVAYRGPDASQDAQTKRYNGMITNLQNAIGKIDKTYLPAARKKSWKYAGLGVLSGTLGITSTYFGIKSNSRNLGMVSGASYATALRAFYLSYATIAGVKKDKELAELGKRILTDHVNTGNPLPKMDHRYDIRRYAKIATAEDYTPENFGFFDLV